MAADLGDLIARILLDSKEFNTSMKGVESQAQETADKANANLGGLSAGLDSIATAAAGIGAALGLEKFGERALEAAAKTDKLLGAFKALNGPTEETTKLFNDLSDLEFKSLYDFEDTLGPAAKNMLMLGVSADQTKETLHAVVDAAAGLKQGPEWIGSVTDAIAKMSSHLVASGKDMKALQALGIDAWGALADEIGTSIPVAMEKVKAGLVTAETVTSAVTKQMAERFDGAAERSMNSWKGAMHILDESSENALVAIGHTIKNILDTDAKPIIEAASKLVQDFATQWEKLPGPLQEALVLVPAIIVGITGAAAAFSGLAVVMGALEFNPVVLGVTAVVAALALIGKWAYENWPAIKAVFEEGVAYLADVFSPLIEVWKAEWEAITTVLSFAWESIKKGTTDLIEGVGKVIEFFGGMVSHLPFSDELKKIGSIWEAEQGKLAAAKAALEEKKKADDEAAAAETERIKRAKEAEARELAAANEAKKAAEEKKKNAAEWEAWSKKITAADEKLQASAKKNETDFTKAYNGMKKAVEETAEVTVGVFERLGGESSPMAVAIKRFGDAKYAMEKLGVTSTQVLTQAVADAQAYVAKVGEAYEHGQASASDYGAALAAVAEKEKALKEYTERDLVAAMKTLGITTSAALQKAADDTAAAYERLRASGTATAADLYNAWQKVKDAQQAVADNANKELADAFHTLGLKSTQELNDYATKATAAYEKIAATVQRNSQDELRARIEMLEAIKEARRRNGEDWSKQDQKDLDDSEKRLKDYTKKAKDVWAELFKHIEDIGKKFKNDVLDKIWDRLFGPDQNAALKKQEAELTASLGERAKEWEAYVSESGQQMENLAADYDAAMQKQAQATSDALDSAAKEYDDYAAGVVENIEEIKQKHADAAAGEIEKAKDALDKKTQDYADYADEVAQNIEEIKKKYADQLEEETEKLHTELRDRTQSYQDFVDDANTSLARLGQDTATNIEDETKDTQRNIADRTTDYNRYAENTAKKIAEVRAKNKGVYSDEEGDLLTSLRRKKEDLDAYAAEQNEKLERYVRDQKLRQSREEDDLHDSLDRKSRDYDEFLQANAKEQDDAVLHYHEGQDKEIQKQEDALGQKAKDLDAATAATAAQIEKIRVTHAAEQDAEIKKQLESLAQKKLDYDQHVAAILAKSAEQTAGIKADYEKNTSDLTGELAKQKAAYDTFVTDITGPNGKLAELKAQHTSIWTDIGTLATGALNEIGKSIIHLASDEVIGLLTGKTTSLKQIWTDLQSVVDGVGSSAAKAAGNIPGGGAPEAPGGGGGGGGGAASAVSGGLTGWISAISGAVTAISSVIGNFQMAHMETSLNAIEHNTRYTMMYVGERSDGGILGQMFKLNEEVAFGYTTKAIENLRDLFADWRAPALDHLAHSDLALVSIARDMTEGVVPLLQGMSATLEVARDALTTGLPGLLRSGFESLNVTVTATGVTTVEAARKLGDQIAANLSRQLVQTS